MPTPLGEAMGEKLQVEAYSPRALFAPWGFCQSLDWLPPPKKAGLNCGCMLKPKYMLAIWTGLCNGKEARDSTHQAWGQALAFPCGSRPSLP